MHVKCLFNWFNFDRKFFPEDKYSTYDQMKQNVSLILLNTHFSSNGPRSYLPNVIEIGGIQIKSKPLPLPKVRKLLFLS